MPVIKRRKADGDAPEVNTDTPLSLPSLPSSHIRSTPRLPFEIYSNILERLNDDDNKSSLARCMRVSSTLNRVTAPILYRTVTLRAGTTSPYDTTCGRHIPARISSDTINNIDLIKNVIIMSHPTYHTVDRLFQGPINVESLRSCLLVLRAGEKCSQCPAHGPTTAPYQPCRYISMYRPKKLVLFGSRNDSSSHALDFETLQTVVFVISSFQPPHVSVPIPPASRVIKRIIQIFWTKKPTGFCGYTPSGPHSIHPLHRQKPEDYVKYFSIGVYWLLRFHPQLENMIVVNGGYIHHLGLGLENPKSRQEKEIKFEAMVYKTLSEQPGIKVECQQGEISAEYNDQTNKRTIKIKFISLRDYLQTHDWSGEFTEKEVKPWLEDDHPGIEIL